MNDDINLPLLPKAIEPMHSEDAMRDYARAAVIADRKRRPKLEPEKAEKVHKTTVFPDPPSLPITVCWTKDRVWIDSAERREAARLLRNITAVLLQRSWYTLAKNCNTAADLLDGGER